MDTNEITNIVLDYACGRKGTIEATCDLLRLLPREQTARQVQLASDYFEEILTQVKYERLPLDIATTGLSEALSATGSEPWPGA